MKRCPRCEETKSLDQFHKHSRDGHQTYCKDCKRVLNRQWKQQHPEQNREWSRQWYRSNKEWHKAYKYGHYRANTDLYRENDARRRARMHGNGVYRVTRQEWAVLKAGPCAHCGSTADIEVDHIIPISRGGRHSIGNLQSLCRACNRSKRDQFDFKARKQ